ncbi:MAG: hypothetical protein IKK11_07725 [Oscillospiraceae bacterium]|nr:hypothetical protein [Oscillospiraceae bacterium]
MYKLLIADASEPYAEALQRALQHDFHLKICSNGPTALAELPLFQPDAMILNLMLPYKDGLTVLHEAAFRPKVILAITPYVNEYIRRQAVALGVQFIMIMPTVNALRVRLMDLIASSMPAAGTPQTQAATHLHTLNFLTHLDGYRQLCVAIPLFAQNPRQSLSKELYPAIARELGLSDARSVEHSVRKAIAAAWAKKDTVVWANYFPPDDGDYITRPTNKQFIAQIAERLVL